MPREVTVGGRQRVVEEFNTVKNRLFAELLGRLGGEGVTVMRKWQEYARAYSEENPIRFPREMVQAALAEAKQEKDQDRVRTWQAVLKEMGDAQYVERPGDVDGRVLMAAIAPLVVEKLKPELQYVLGLVMIPHSEMKEAGRDGEGSLAAAIKAVGYDIEYDTTLAEATAILTAGVELFLEDATAAREALGKLKKELNRLLPTMIPGATDEDDHPSEPSSSIDSDGSTTGPPTSSSTTSPTEKSAA